MNINLSCFFVNATNSIYIIYNFNSLFQVRSVQKQVARIRTICKYFHQSPKATSVLSKKQELLGMQKLNVITDCPTRWNSTYYMLERFSHIRQAIIAALLSDELSKKKNDFSYLFSMS